MTQLFTRDKKTGKVVPLVVETTPAGKPITEYEDSEGRIIVVMAHAADGSLIPYEQALKEAYGFDSQGHAFRRSDGLHIYTECRGRGDLAHLQHFPTRRGQMSDAAQREFEKLEAGSLSATS